eukprot:gene19752-21688_t
MEKDLQVALLSGKEEQSFLTNGMLEYEQGIIYHQALSMKPRKNLSHSSRFHETDKYHQVDCRDCESRFENVEKPIELGYIETNFTDSNEGVEPSCNHLISKSRPRDRDALVNVLTIEDKKHTFKDCTGKLSSCSSNTFTTRDISGHYSTRSRGIIERNKSREEMHSVEKQIAVEMNKLGSSKVRKLSEHLDCDDAVNKSVQIKPSGNYIPSMIEKESMFFGAWEKGIEIKKVDENEATVKQFCKRQNNNKVRRRRKPKSLIKYDALKTCDNLEDACSFADKASRTEESNGLQSVDIEQVLGMRISDNGLCDILVQFKNGTSNWIRKDNHEILKNAILDCFSVSSKNHCILHRLPFSFYYKTDVSDDIVCNDKVKGTTQFKKSFIPSLSLNCKEPATELKSVKKELYSSNKNSTLLDKSCMDLQLSPHTWKRLSPEFEQDLVDSAQGELSILDKTTSSHSIIGELQIINSEFTEIVLQHKDKRSKRIKAETCDNLIQQLDLKSIDNNCKLIILCGFEEYFSSSMDLERVVKAKADLESTQHDEVIGRLRYLFQTLKNYPKPIIAIINSAATGLAASVLSMVDVVYDKSSDISITENTSCKNLKLPLLIPRLMGLQIKNEALLMGEVANSVLDRQLQQVKKIYKEYQFSKDLKATLHEMKINEKLSNEGQHRQRRQRLSGDQSNLKPLKKRNYNRAFESENSNKCYKRCGMEPTLSSIKGNLQHEVKKEKDLAISCLKDLTDFWKELV